MTNLETEPKLIQDLWNTVNNDGYAWIPVWGPGRCGKTTLAMIASFKLYKDWDDVLASITFDLTGAIYRMKKGLPRLFPTVTKPCHMRVPIMIMDDFAAKGGKAKTQHEKAWDLFKGGFDTLGTRIGVILATMINPRSPTQQLMEKYTHEIKVERISDDKRIYKYDKCDSEQDYKGWRNRQNKDWKETQEFGTVPSDVYKQYDEMRMSLVDEVFEGIEEQMVSDSLTQILNRIEEVDVTLLNLIKETGPTYDTVIKEKLGSKYRQAMIRCKNRSLITPIRKSKWYYHYDITDLGLEVLNAINKPTQVNDSQKSQISPTIIT